MPNPNSPYFALASLLGNCPNAITPAELQGVLLGRSCAGAGFAPEAWLAEACELLGAPAEGALQQALLGLQRMVQEELISTQLALTLLLPEDEAPLSVRAQALGHWCQGFLDGFGQTIGDQALSLEAVDGLQDLTSIAQIGDQLEDSEDSETDYMEVTEYVRVVPLLLFTECGRVPAAASAPVPPVDILQDADAASKTLH